MGEDERLSVLPLVEETLKVSVRDAVSGRVRVSTPTDTIEEVVRQELHGTRADVERVPIDRTLDLGETPPGPRIEGDVTIIPIFEEVVIVEKRLVLKEELRIVRRTTSETIEVPVELRRQRAVIEHLPGEADTSSSSGENDG